MKNLPELNEKESKLELSSQGYVTLPFNNDEFKEFVVGLLGKPQTIDGIVKGAFEIGVTEIRNVYELINQRITQQNDGTLIQFNARINFSDESSILINSIEELLTYNVIKPVISTAIHLSFQYLIRFLDKKVPEKQEINISFIPSREKLEDSEITFGEKTVQSFAQRVTPEVSMGFIQFTIKHTARTWGADIESLLSNHFKSIMLPEAPSKRFLREYKGTIALCMFLIIFGLGIYSAITVSNIKEAQNNAKIEAAFKKIPLTIQDISDKIEFVARNRPYSSELLPLMTLLSLILGIAMSIFTFSTIENPQNSYILLTSESFKNKEIQDKKYNRQFLKFIWFLIVSISCDLVANYLFLYFNKS